jgi:hypothetical protein
MSWLCSKQNCLLCAYECDFGDNDIITIRLDRSYNKKYVPVLSVLNLVSDFVKCNRPIALYSKHLREWLFHSRPGVGVTNYLGVGTGSGSG